MLSGNGWISSLRIFAQSGDPTSKSGLAYMQYSVTKDMAPQTAFSSILDTHIKLSKLLSNEIAALTVPSY